MCLIRSRRRSHGTKDWLAINLDRRLFYGFTPRAAHRWYAAQVRRAPLSGASRSPGSGDMSESIATRIPAELLELILGSLDDDDCVAFGRACPFFRDVAVDHLRARFEREMADGGWRGDRVICAGDWSDGGRTHLQALSMALASAKEGIITVTALDECRCCESRTAEEMFDRLGSSARMVFPLEKYHERKVCFEVYWGAGLNGDEINVPRDEGEAPERGNETFEPVSVICIQTMVIDSQ